MFRRLKNLWRLSKLYTDIPKHTMNGQDSVRINPQDIGYEYEGKPQGVIIKKDNLEEVLDEITK